MPQNQLLQPRQHPSAESADGPCGNFEHPNATLIDAHFGMDGTFGQAKCIHRSLRGFNDRYLGGWIFTRWRHVNSLFEERAIQRIRLVEKRQHAKLSIRENAFEREL